MLQNDEARPVEFVNRRGGSAFILVCEHAGRLVPASMNSLGLSEAELDLHIAWDPGAEALARNMSVRFDAPLLLQPYSRLVIDCNRPPRSPGAILSSSETITIPGNENIADAERERRIATFHTPIHDAVDEVLSARRAKGLESVLVTVHSFTPVYYGVHREVEIGILHDTDARLADQMLALAGDHSNHLVRRNEPYSPKDGVTYTLNRHAIGNGLANVMLEIRSDLIRSKQAQLQMSEMLCGWIAAGHEALGADAEAVS